MKSQKKRKKEKKREKKLAYDVMPTCVWYATLFTQTWYTHNVPHVFNDEAVRLGDSRQGTYLHDPPTQECGNPG